MKLVCVLTALMLTLAAIGRRAVGGEVSAPSITEPKAASPTVAPAPAATTPSTFPSFAPTVPAPSARTGAPTPAAVIVFKGEVDDYSRDALFKRFDQAKAAGAKVIILKLNTPGGLVSAGLDISAFLRKQKDVHVVAYVNRYALSAGIMIGLACDELVMEPETKVGDSAPIAISSSGDLQSLGETERAKMESPILADFYASSVRNGYDPLLTSSMVTMNRVVHYVQSAKGEKKFVDEKGYQDLIEDGWKPVEGVPDPVDRADSLLTLNADVAEKVGISKGTFTSPDALAAARNYTIVSTFAPDSGDKFIGWLGSDWIRGILIVVLLQALYMAFSHPGHGWIEAIALVTLGLLVGVPLLTGMATWWEVVAIFVGLFLLALEIFVIPGFGVTGIVGLLLFFGGLVLTFVGTEPSLPGGVMPGLPAMRGTWINLQHGLFIVTGGLACSLFLWFWLNRYLPKMPYFNKLILTTVTGDLSAPTGPIVIAPPESGPAIGDAGVAVSELKPGGSVKFITDSYPDGRIAAVISESGWLPAGTPVTVREVAGNRVIVRRQT